MPHLDSFSLSADAIAAQLQMLLEQREFEEAFLIFYERNSDEITELLHDSNISEELNAIYLQHVESLKSKLEKKLIKELTPKLTQQIAKEQRAIQKKALAKALEISSESAESILTLITAIKGLTTNA